MLFERRGTGSAMVGGPVSRWAAACSGTEPGRDNRSRGSRSASSAPCRRPGTCTSARPRIALARSGLKVIVKEALADGRLAARDAEALAAALAQPWATVVLSGAASLDVLRSNLRALEDAAAGRSPRTGRGQRRVLGAARTAGVELSYDSLLAMSGARAKSVSSPTSSREAGVAHDVVEHVPTYTAVDEAAAYARRRALHGQDDRPPRPRGLARRGAAGQPPAGPRQGAPAARRRRRLRLATEDGDGGGVPGGTRPVPCRPSGRSSPEVVDMRLLYREAIVCAGGDHRHAIRLDPRDLLKLAEPRIGRNLRTDRPAAPEGLREPAEDLVASPRGRCFGEFDGASLRRALARELARAL